MMSRPSGKGIDEWFASPAAALSAADSINSSYDDKCPFVRGRQLVFASDRPGGLGGFDLYFSVFRNGKWSVPVNMGPSVNSPANEYRPVIGTDNRFEKQVPDLFL